MVKTLEGNLVGTGLKMGITVSRFNDFFSQKLLEGALDCLTRHGVKDGDITVVWVPGAFELPLAARKMASSGKFDAVIALGALIRGATPHFDYIASEVTKGLANASLELERPISYGVITTDTLEQAIERSGTKAGNKGFHSALAAIEMANLMKTL
ncbi:MAG: 6,7-dimethyl-8-ribityllumazine synthase [Acidobacteriota bacterium]|jgi:6,7-dimethyl-8-ribityllumazine synthase